MKIPIVWTIIIFLLVLISLVPGVTADDQTVFPDIPVVAPGTINSAFVPNQTHVPVVPPSLSPEQEAQKKAVMEEQDRLNTLRKANRSFWERKLDSKLLSLIESDTYIGTGKISEQELKLMMDYSNVIPSDQVQAKLGITVPTGDLFLVNIRVNSTASSVHIVDPYVKNILSTNGNDIHCWVELSNLQNIASLDDVIQIQSIYKPVLNVYHPDGPDGTTRDTIRNSSPSLTQSSPSVKTTNSIPITIIQTATMKGTLSPHPVESESPPATPLSVTDPFAAVAVVAMLVVSIKTREKTVDQRKNR